MRTTAALMLLVNLLVSACANTSKQPETVPLPPDDPQQSETVPPQPDGPPSGSGELPAPSREPNPAAEVSVDKLLDEAQIRQVTR